MIADRSDVLFELHSLCELLEAHSAFELGAAEYSMLRRLRLARQSYTHAVKRRRPKHPQCGSRAREEQER